MSGSDAVVEAVEGCCTSGERRWGNGQKVKNEEGNNCFSWNGNYSGVMKCLQNKWRKTKIFASDLPVQKFAHSNLLFLENPDKYSSIHQPHLLTTNHPHGERRTLGSLPSIGPNKQDPAADNSNGWPHSQEGGNKDPESIILMCCPRYAN